MAWTHEEIKQETKKWGIELTVKFVRDGTGNTHFTTMRFDDADQLAAEKADRIAHIKNILELAWSRLNQFDLGEDAKEIIRAAVIQIRNTPAVTFAQAEVWYDNNFPDSLWRFDIFMSRAREFLRDELGFVPTWDQFKTYVINNVFEGVDG